ncbi:IPT/TIG domain-containing protein [Streptomyces sp. NBC_01615]|uniref:IPT/TIG domain-containing protein n=1 Tax=Streptomyces sp. NBC_01615 TaxID=2975898 RepID=UPI0038668B9A
MQITDFKPPSGPVETKVSLSLTDMPSDASIENTTVLLSGSPSANVTAVEATNGTIEVTIETNAQSGEFGVTVRSGQGPASAQSSTVFTVDASPGEPQIRNMTPRTAVAGRTLLTLTGQHLDQIQYLRIGNVNVMSLQHPSPETIRAMVPTAVQSGQQRVTGQSQEYGRVNCPYMLTVQ